MVCVELAWPSPGMTDKTQGGARCSQPSLVLDSGVCFIDGLVGIFARTCGCGYFTRIFGCEVRIFFRGFWAADFFVDFVMACAEFGVWIFSSDFLGCFPAKIGLKKSHQKIPPKNPH